MRWLWFDRLTPMHLRGRKFQYAGPTSVVKMLAAYALAQRVKKL